MATFTYTARDASGQPTTGEVNATDRADATRQIRSTGRFVVQIQEKSKSSTVKKTASAQKFPRAKQADVVYFAHQMALMIDAGVPVAEALDGIIRQSKPGPWRTILSDLLGQVESGVPFSSALANHRRSFGDMFINLVRAAELSGRMGTTLSRIAAYMTRQRQIAGRIKGALVYPAILVFMCTGMVIFLLTFMLPKFMVIYRGKMELLPTPTKIIAGLSDWLVTYWMYWSAGSVVTIMGLILFFRSTRGSIVKDWLLLNVPIIGKVTHRGILARSMHTMGTLIDSGVSMLDTISIVRRISGNHFFKKVWQQVDNDLQSGMQLSTPLYGSPLFPRSYVQMIDAGERAGKLGPVLRELSSFLETDLNNLIEYTTRLIEPALIATMGVVVGGIAASMLLPIFSLSKLAH